MDITHPQVPHLGMRLAFRNSYDKSMSVAFAAGAVAWVCSNGMISGDVQYVKTYGSVAEEINTKIVTTIEQLDDHFKDV